MSARTPNNDTSHSGLALPSTNAAELSALDLPELVFTVDRLLPEGLALLIGKPKCGKSWLLLQLALAVASGRPFLGYPTSQRPVLYLALEDGRRRLRKRQRQLLAGLPEPELLDLITVENKWPRADQGGQELLASWLTEPEHAGGLALIDTVGRYRPLAGHGNAYMLDLAALEPLQSMALERHSTILASHHDNKRLDVGDWVYSISGTQAVAGTADTLLGLSRRAGSDLALLKTHGRDTDETNLILRLDQEPFGWTAIGAVLGDGGQLTPEREAIIHALTGAIGGLAMDEFYRLFSDEKPETVRMRMSRMVDDGLLERTTRGAYNLITRLLPLPTPPSGNPRNGRNQPNPGNSSYPDNPPSLVTNNNNVVVDGNVVEEAYVRVITGDDDPTRCPNCGVVDYKPHPDDPANRRLCLACGRGWLK